MPARVFICPALDVEASFEYSLGYVFTNKKTTADG